ncbi:hypothetical protein Tco_0855443 [Tanacetum coccineum]
MNRGFLDSRGRNNNHRKKTNTVDGIGSFMESDGTLNDVNPLKEVVSPSIPVAMEMQRPVVDKTNAGITDVGSYLPLPTQGTNPAGNTPGKSSYATVIGESSRKALNIRTLYTLGGTELMLLCQCSLLELLVTGLKTLLLVYFWESEWPTPFSMDGFNAMLENGLWLIRSHPIILKKWNPDDGMSSIAAKLDTPIMLDSYTADMCLQSWGRSSYARVMNELLADMELKDSIVVECPKSPGLGAGAGETKNPKKTSQAPKGYPVGPKMAFKPNQEYRHVLKTHTANSSGNKKKGVDSTNMVSDSNPFEVLNSVDNDVEMGTNDGRQIWIRTGLIQVEPRSGMSKLVIEYPSDHDSEDEVASVDNDMARSLALERTRSGRQSLLEQWRDSHGDDD